jgi:hypothetical protein
MKVVLFQVVYLQAVIIMNRILMNKLNYRKVSAKIHLLICQIVVALKKVKMNQF